MTSHIQPEKKCDYCGCPESTATEAGVLCNMTPGKPLHSFQEKTQQPEASWDLRKQFKEAGIDFDSENGRWNAFYGHTLEFFISKAIAEAVEAERRRIIEAIEEEVNLEQLDRYRCEDSKLAHNSYGAGHSYGNWEMAEKILSIINSKI